jgi:glutaminase
VADSPPSNLDQTVGVEPAGQQFNRINYVELTEVEPLSEQLRSRALPYRLK